MPRARSNGYLYRYSNSAGDGRGAMYGRRAPGPVRPETCRRSGCGEEVTTDSEWCAGHTTDVVAGRIWAEQETERLRHTNSGRHRLMAVR